ncbi:MAG: hypothetical protein DWQ10_14610 [Calditrichaeota bacterium]|nr:MAG: hypothetical protein DWQ10_14610 [Calditrichota bacterium]
MDTLKTGAYYTPFKGDNGYYSMKKGETRLLQVPPLDQIKNRIWQTLYHTRRHLIQQEIDNRLASFSSRFNLVRKEDSIEKAKIKLTGTKEYNANSPVNSDSLSEADFDEVLATMDGGQIKLIELFPDAKKAPYDISEFDNKLKNLIEQIVLAAHAKELDYQSIPEINEQLNNIRNELLRTLLYKHEVKEKVSAAMDLITGMSPKEKQQKQRSMERELREKLEQELKNNFGFKFVNGSFSTALAEARRQKEIQIKEKEEKEKAKP